MPIGYVLRRIGVFFLVIWAAATINFAIPRLSPADPIKEQTLTATTIGQAQKGSDVLTRTFATCHAIDQPV